MNLTKITQDEYADISAVKEFAIKKIKDEVLTEFSRIHARWQDDTYGGVMGFDFFMRNLSYETRVVYTPEDISAYCIYASTLKNTTSVGTFLSALINHHHNKKKFTGEYILPLQHYEKPLQNIGFQLSGNCVVYGNVSTSAGRELLGGNLTINGSVISHQKNADTIVGYDMQSGFICINGNGGSHVGMGQNGGRILINGSVEISTGQLMRGGNIVVKGFSGKTVGAIMKEGTIYIYGERGVVGIRREGGKIYHNDILIDDDK